MVPLILVILLFGTGSAHSTGSHGSKVLLASLVKQEIQNVEKHVISVNTWVREESSF